MMRYFAHPASALNSGGDVGGRKSDESKRSKPIVSGKNWNRRGVNARLTAAKEALTSTWNVPFWRGRFATESGGRDGEGGARTSTGERSFRPRQFQHRVGTRGSRRQVPMGQDTPNETGPRAPLTYVRKSPPPLDGIRRRHYSVGSNGGSIAG